MKRGHHMPFGAECREDGSVRFRLWAPEAHQVELRLQGQVHLSPAKQRTSAASGRVSPQQPTSPPLWLASIDKGWFELITDQAGPGSLYKFLIDGTNAVPDPSSRFQPQDVHGPSEMIDPAGFRWSDDDWRGRPWEEAVIYELHVGTFSPEGTFAAVQQRLDYLADLGITAVELMPLADFPGSRNWGYDGVLLYAPDSSYGRPEDLKRLIEAAHARNVMVFLDVVYNHFGPEGNYLRAYAPQFFTHRHCTPWGDAIDFDGPCRAAVREFFVHNALYWLEEYHFDGLRLDAVHAIKDDSDPDILTELAERVRAHFPADRHIHLVLENDDNRVRYLARDRKNCPRLYNAQWNDDIHHAFHVLLTGETDGYYADYRDQPIQRLGRCLAEGFDFQGQLSPYRENKPRGESSRDLPPTAFVSFLQNHDQVGNRAFGERILELANEQALRAATAILCLAPSVPLLFMGEEFGVKTPFLFFCDFEPQLARTVTEGRRNEFARFARFGTAESRAKIPDPGALDSFLRSKLDWSSLNQNWLSFYRELLRVRAVNIVPRLRGRNNESGRYKTWGDRALSVEWVLAGAAKLRLLANLGADIVRLPVHPAGRLIYSLGEIKGGSIPPRSVAWLLDP